MSLGRIGKYEILERIGAGGIGVVFRARDTFLDRVVALKVLSEANAAEPELRARLMREARLEASLSHPNIATCFEVAEDVPVPDDLLDPDGIGPHPGRILFLTMEYVPGTDLLALVEGKPLPIPRVLDLAIQIAAGLEAAHGAGVIHRDLKPGNVRVTPDGLVKILDFGLACIRAPGASGALVDTSSFRTSEGRIMGTAPYMAPEQARGGTVDARSDLFSFGVVLYQAVTGRLPFTGQNSLEVFYAAASEEAPPLARFARGVPDELERIVQKLLAKRPEERYQSAHEVLTDLRRLDAGRAPSSRGYARVHAGRRRSVAVTVTVVLALAVAAALAGWWARTGWLPPSHNLAVLAFESAGGDESLDRLAGGLAQELRTDLVQHTSLNVASQAAVAGTEWRGRPPRAIGRELGVGSILTGDVRRDGETARLQVELVDTRSGWVRWSSSYDLVGDPGLRIERDLLEQVAAHLRSRLVLPASGTLAGHPTHAPRAYDAYLAGIRELEDPDDPQALDRAADRFGVALAQDPDFALAWAGRARALLMLYRRDRRPEALRSAEQACDQAVRLAPDLVEARVARSEFLRATGRTDEAIAELKQVVARRPQWDEACVQIGATYRDAGQLAEAERWFRRALGLRPDYWRNWNSLGSLLKRRGDYRGARAAFVRIVDLVPDKSRGYEQLAALDMLEGRPDSAIAEYRRLPTPVQDGDLAANIGTAYFYVGRLSEALEFYGLAARLKPDDALMRRNLGDCYVRAGRPDEARAAYREAVRLTDGELARNPRNPELCVTRALYLAKAGDCAGASRALADVPARLRAESADLTYDEAMVHSLCGERARAVETLRHALALGVPRERILGDDEFRPLREDPGFRRLTGGRPPAPAPGSVKGPTGSP